MGITDHFRTDLSKVRASRIYVFRSDTGEAVLIYESNEAKKKRLYNTDLIGGL